MAAGGREGGREAVSGAGAESSQGSSFPEVGGGWLGRGRGRGGGGLRGKVTDEERGRELVNGRWTCL